MLVCLKKNVNELYSVARDLDRLKKDDKYNLLAAREMQHEWMLKKLEMDKTSELIPAQLKSSFPDAALVALFYQQIGLLPSYPFANDYAVKNFVTEEKGNVPLSLKHSLSSEIFVRL